MLTASVFLGGIYTIYTREIEHKQEVKNLTADVANREKVINKKQEELDNLSRRIEELEVSRGAYRQRLAVRQQPIGMDMIVTAYDLSVESCGKSPDSSAYGVTASGRNIAGQSRESAMVIAVDPNVIPLGSQVMISFHDESMQKYDGIYTAADTGGAINGNRIDLFMGEGSHYECMRFGRRTASVAIVS